MCLAIFPSSTMWTVSCMSACRNALVMSLTTTHLPSFVSMLHDIIIASSDNVGDLASSFWVYSHSGHPSAHPVTFMVPYLFSLMNIRYLRAFHLYSLFRSSFFLGTIAFLSCNCPVLIPKSVLFSCVSDSSSVFVCCICVKIVRHCVCIVLYIHACDIFVVLVWWTLQYLPLFRFC